MHRDLQSVVCCQLPKPPGAGQSSQEFVVHVKTLREGARAADGCVCDVRTMCRGWHEGWREPQIAAFGSGQVVKGSMVHRLEVFLALLSHGEAGGDEGEGAEAASEGSEYRQSLVSPSRRLISGCSAT